MLKRRILASPTSLARLKKRVAKIAKERDSGGGEEGGVTKVKERTREEKKLEAKFVAKGMD